MVANVVFQRFSSPIFTRIQALRAELSEIAHESFDGAMVVKTLGREAEETERFAAKARALRDEGIRAGRLRAAFDPAIEALPNLGVLAVLGVGVWRVSTGLADAGDVVTIAYLLTIVAFPIRSIGWLLGEFPRSVVGFRPGAPGARHGQRDDVRRERRWRLDAVRRAARRRPPRLRLRARRAASSTTSTSPSSPAAPWPWSAPPPPARAPSPRWSPGSSTRAAGAVRLDGPDLRDLAPGELARHVALVPQSAFLFDDTVRDNVTLGADVPDEEVWEALRTAQADGFVAGLPHGLDSRLGERGTTLSGGQRQRLSLARALVRRPRLLVLDDATSAVDPEVEARILAAMRQPPRRRRRRLDAAADRLPQGDHRAGRRGAVPPGRPDRRPGHPRASCSRATPATPTSSTPTRPRRWRAMSDRTVERADQRQHPCRQWRRDRRPRHDPARAGLLARAR